MSAGDAPPGARFAWPPGVRSPRDTPPSTRPRPGEHARDSLWRSIERVWLAETRPPLDERIARAGWAPDDPDAYCPRCATSVGPFDADADGCAACRGRRLAWDHAVRLGSHEGLLRDLVHEIKFRQDRHAGARLGEMLGRAVVARLLRAGINPATAVVVPVPTTFRRRVHRGIDHASAIARAVAPVGSMTLLRPLARAHRPSQLSLPMSERRRNVAGSMRPRPGVGLADRPLVVVDDVRTTGATMTGACRALRRARGPSKAPMILAAVLAVTPANRAP
jgi:predicted amidophosphoribosyltransferase